MNFNNLNIIFIIININNRIYTKYDNIRFYYPLSLKFYLQVPMAESISHNQRNLSLIDPMVGKIVEFLEL